MSAHGFHVHGPHDQEVEHVAQHGGDNFTSRVAVLTASLLDIAPEYWPEMASTKRWTTLAIALWI